MLGRLVYVFAVASLTVLVCAGVVLAQDAPDQQAPASEVFDDTAGLDPGDPVPGKYIVVLEDDVERPSSVADDLSGELDLQTTNVYDEAVEGFAAEVPAGELSELRADPRVEAVVQDRVIEATRQVIPAGIKRIDAPQSSTRAGNGRGKVNADIAILDSGIYKKHTDLNIAGGYNCQSQKRRAWSDGDGHGTHVAGTAAAKDNRAGVVGVAPGARLWGIKVLDNRGSGTFSEIICGIDWVTRKNNDGDASNDIEVANMSLGATVEGADDTGCGWVGNNAADLLNRAVCRSVKAGAFYAVAAGNSTINFANDVPASFDQVLTTTAMADFDGRPGSESSSICGGETDDKFASFSNYATANTPDEEHTIAAPGVCVRSTWNNGKYKSISGTSMASPHVAGTAALCIVRGECPTGNPQGTTNKLRSDAATRPDSYGFIGDPDTGGIVNYYGYLEYAGGY
jgi:subtilisin